MQSDIQVESPKTISLHRDGGWRELTCSWKLCSKLNLAVQWNTPLMWILKLCKIEKNHINIWPMPKIVLVNLAVWTASVFSMFFFTNFLCLRLTSRWHTGFVNYFYLLTILIRIMAKLSMSLLYVLRLSYHHKWAEHNSFGNM